VLALDLRAVAAKSVTDVAKSDTSPAIAPWVQAQVPVDTAAASSNSLVATAVVVAVKPATRAVALAICHATAHKDRSVTTVGHERAQATTKC